MSSQIFIHQVKQAEPANSVYPDISGSAHALTASARRLDRRIEVVVRLLQSNSHKQISIEEMARLVNLSPGRLAHLFKSEMQLSLQQYLTHVRLAKAKGHLESSFLSIKEIAASVGFTSATRFGVCFKNIVGATPAQYRKQCPTVISTRGNVAAARSAKT